MDKIIEKKTGWRVAFTKKALLWWLGALLLAFVIYLIARPNNKTLRVDKDTVTISNAVKGVYNKVNFRQNGFEKGASGRPFQR